MRTPTDGGPAQRITYTYDGPLVTQVSVSGVTTGTTSYSYDNNFLVSAINLTSGTDTFNSTITRDKDGLITSFGPFTYTRNGPAGAVTAISDLTLNLTFGYDGYGRMSSKDVVVNKLPILGFDYTYDVLGRITSIKETTSDTSAVYDYTYDMDGQLTGKKKNGELIESYTYDANGNRTGYAYKGPNSFDLTATYDAQDRIVQQGQISYSFNVDGYMTKGLFADSCQYSARGELLNAVAWSDSINYSYDGTGRRVARTDSSGTYQYFYTNQDQPFEVTAVRDPKGNFTAYYYDTSDALFAIKRGTSTYYVASDHLGTPRFVVDSTGTVIEKIEYDSYGVLFSNTNPGFDIPIGFAGGLPDITGLIRFGFRDYEAGSGRWLNRDPLLFKSAQPNLYHYVGNDPINSKDRNGLQGTMAIPGSAGLPLFVPPGSVFVPGSQPNKVFVQSVEEVLQLFNPSPLVRTVADKVSDMCKKKEEDCDSEIAECRKLCSHARRDPDMKNIWGGSFETCMKGCVSQRCGGN